MGKRKRCQPDEAQGGDGASTSVAPAVETDQPDDAQTELTFEQFGLDDRIMKAICKLGWREPTAVQRAFVPLALDGNDIIAGARTGSGKTAAYLLPVIQSILQTKTHRRSGSDGLKCLALAPTKELSRQIAEHAAALCSCTGRLLTVVDLAAHSDINAQKCLLSSAPDIVTCTPARVVAHLKCDASLLNSLQYLVMDEADMLFSFGFEQDLSSIKDALPSTYQAFLTSATMNDDVNALKKLVLRRPVTLRLEESALPPITQLAQYHVRLEEEDKFTLLYALLKLKLLQGKAIIFVKDTDRCYQLALFMRQFGVRACVLNSEMPLNSRCHVVHQFNMDMYEYIVASDENDRSVAAHGDATPAAGQAGDAQHDVGGDDDGGEAKPKSKRARRRRGDKEFGAARGIDFQRVANVVNFDMPPSVDAYIHRVGRTARGANKGTAISFASSSEAAFLNDVIDAVAENMGSDSIRPYQFRMDELDGFRYRAREMQRAVTSSAIRETRLGEIRAELVRSKELDGYFAKNERELAALRHDKVMHANVRSKPQLMHVPQYIVPTSLRPSYKEDITKSRKGRKGGRNLRGKNFGGAAKMTRQQDKFVKKKADPLKSFTL